MNARGNSLLPIVLFVGAATTVVSSVILKSTSATALSQNRTTKAVGRGFYDSEIAAWSGYLNEGKCTTKLPNGKCPLPSNVILQEVGTAPASTANASEAALFWDRHKIAFFEGEVKAGVQNCGEASLGEPKTRGAIRSQVCLRNVALQPPLPPPTPPTPPPVLPPVVPATGPAPTSCAGYFHLNKCFYGGHYSCDSVCAAHGGGDPVCVTMNDCVHLQNYFNFRRPEINYQNNSFNGAAGTCAISHNSRGAFAFTRCKDYPDYSRVDPAMKATGRPAWLLVCACKS